MQTEHIMAKSQTKRARNLGAKLDASTGHNPTKSKNDPRHSRRTRSSKNIGPSKTAGKIGLIVAMLRKPKGANIEGLCKATGWQAHSVRATISATIKKNLGFKVTSKKANGVRIYRVVG
jgi:hypothetical protein